MGSRPPAEASPASATPSRRASRGAASEVLTPPGCQSLLRRDAERAGAGRAVRLAVVVGRSVLGRAPELLARVERRAALVALEGRHGRMLTAASDGCAVMGAMDDAAARAREIAEADLGHPVPHALPPGEEGLIVAASVAGEPPCARVAWVTAEGGVVARVLCPPGRPSRWRPVVAAAVALEAPPHADRVLVARLAAEATAALPQLAMEETAPPAGVGGEGLVLARIPAEVAVLAVDALDASGEPVGRLARPGLSELRFDGASVSGRLGATHGMGAGIGAGRWAAGLAEAGFEAGYEPWLPTWMPEGLARGRPRVEPDIAYPAAPPAIVIAWTGGDGARVLLRQAPAPLASPETGGRSARRERIGDVEGVLRGPRL